MFDPTTTEYLQFHCDHLIMYIYRRFSLLTVPANISNCHIHIPQTKLSCIHSNTINCKLRLTSKSFELNSFVTAPSLLLSVSGQSKKKIIYFSQTPLAPLYTTGSRARRRRRRRRREKKISEEEETSGCSPMRVQRCFFSFPDTIIHLFSLSINQVNACVYNFVKIISV